MTESDDVRKTTYESQTTEQYAALGQFVQEFGQICNWLQVSFVQLLSMHGLKDQTISNIIIGQRAITAEPLIQIMEGLVGHLLGDDEVAGKEIFRHTAKRFRCLIRIRNDFVHGTWFIGWANPADTDFSDISGHKLNPNKKGMAIKPLPRSVDEIGELVNEAKQINKLFMRSYACMSLAHMEQGKGDFSKNFTKTDDGRWLPESPK